MKRSINLVSYESSDEDNGDATTRAVTVPASRRKLPKISPLLVVPSPVSDPKLHQGRVRRTPHVEGQFAAFVYVPVLLKQNPPLRVLLEKAIYHAKEVEPALVCDWLDSPCTTYSLHISLTRPIYLRHHQREELKRAVKAAARTAYPFTASFSTFAIFENDERTRAFLGVEIGAGHSELASLSKAIEPALKLLHQEEFYCEPRFHASIAWALLGEPNAPKAEVTFPSVAEPVAKATHPSHVIPSFASSLLPDMNALFGHSLSSSKIGVFEVDSVYVKIGKEVLDWPLGRV